MAHNTYQDLKDGIPTGETTARSITASCLTQAEKNSLLNELADWGTPNNGGGNLVGPVTSVGLTTSIANGAITSNMVATTLSGKIVNGVNLSNSGPATQYLNKLGQYTTPVDLGTVTDVSVATNDGVSGTVATSTTTPVITLELGAITPQSVASVGAVSGTAGTFTSPVTVPAGTAVAPAIISTTGTADTGLFFPAADTVALATAGTERVRITSTGNVGIGNTAPGEKLDVTGNIKASGTVTAVQTYLLGSAVAVRNVVAQGNWFFGGAGNLTATGTLNVGIGINSQQALTTGNNNTASGMYSQYSLTTGSNNTSSGMYSQYSLTTGSSNTASGVYSQYSLTTGNYNTSSGYASQYSLTTGSNNTASGYASQYLLTTGSNNTASGVYSQYFLTTGSSNTASGVYSQSSLTTGSNNIATGEFSGRFISGGGNLTVANDSIFIGNDTRALADSQTNQVVIGHNAIGAGSNSVTLGNTSVTVTTLRGAVTVGQSIRTTPDVYGNLVAAGTAGNGARAYVTDATLAFIGANIGSAAVGGGANHSPVIVVNGAWVIG